MSGDDGTYVGLRSWGQGFQVYVLHKSLHVNWVRQLSIVVLVLGKYMTAECLDP